MRNKTTKPAATIPAVTKVKTVQKAKTTAKTKKPQSIIDASPECAFWMNNGPVVRNLVELKDALTSISDELYDYHTKRDGNNFSKWIDEVLKNAECAKRLLGAKTRQEAIRIIEKYI